ncbi:mannose-1-phosphate guanylyltransferase [Neobacillus muris]|uniref:mannose-1-phosphate guanylyltransferase n=1 Tax=Neobacillus muris TaxID=2941334 RepID=UPI00203F1AD3|nr:sugar phosphate nucleotidyltransferase [Neobacillus muris]
MKVVIMAGGRGTRFWPWSVKDKPKQFLSLMSDESLLQQTYNRFLEWLPPEKIFIVTLNEYVPLVKEQVAGIEPSNLIIEPLQRDTGPCMALTALKFLRENDDEVFAAVPADHHIPEHKDLPDLFKIGENQAEIGRSIVTLGMRPTRPEPGYGYILVDSEAEQKNQVWPVKAFIEKPNMEKAKKLLDYENVFWNSGIFFWKPSTIEHYFRNLSPDIWEELKDCTNISEAQYALLPKISVDYAILEKAETIFMVPACFHWDDVGNWSAWERLHEEKTSVNNLIIGNVHVLSTNNCIIKSDEQKTIVIGVEDLIIVSTTEGLLVCHKTQEQAIKNILDNM